MSKQNPYLNARREWDERYGGLISRARNWQLMAAGSLAVAVVAVVGIAFVGSQSKIQPFVVVTDQLGSPVAVARPAPVARADLDKRLMVAQLAAFIKDVRSMLPDVVAQQVTLNRVYAMAGRDVAGFLNEFFQGQLAVFGRWLCHTGRNFIRHSPRGRNLPGVVGGNKSQAWRGCCCGALESGCHGWD